MNDTPLFIKIHSCGVEGMINVRSISCIAPSQDEGTLVYVQHRESSIYVDESYEKLKKKLEDNVWIV